jgi:hypothetical protein
MWLMKSANLLQSRSRSELAAVIILNLRCNYLSCSHDVRRIIWPVTEIAAELTLIGRYNFRGKWTGGLIVAINVPREDRGERRAG